jgi:RNA polymerase sigma-70 factor, ECF subfamily
VDYSAVSPEEVARACLESGNELAWAEFVRRFHPLIARVVVRVSRRWGRCSSETVDDLVQETYLKFCREGLRGLRNFKSAHEDAIFGYIKVFTANLVHDHFKTSHSQKRGGGCVTNSIEGESGGPGAAQKTVSAALERRLLIEQIDLCLRRVVASGPASERDRKIFWLYYRVGMAASAIATLPGVGLGVKGVESTILRLTRQIKAELVAPERVPKLEKMINMLHTLPDPPEGPRVEEVLTRLTRSGHWCLGRRRVTATRGGNWRSMSG